MVHYDPDKDQSEKYGWKKVRDERVPTEEEQDRWGKIAIVISAKLAMIPIFMEI